MPDPVTAIGVGTAAFGASESRKARKGAQASADRATAGADEAAANALAFEQEKYDDWQSVYGPMQDNLANYYKNLTPDFYAAQGIEEFEKERALATENVDAMLAQRGITGSGIAASIDIQEQISAGETRAGIRAEAPRRVMAEKADFLQIGLGQQPNMSKALQTEATRTAGRLSTAQSNLATAQKGEGAAVGGLINVAGTGLADYLTRDK